MTAHPIEIAYSADGEQALDLYLSAEPERDPLVVYVHGGGFQRGDKRDDQIRIRQLSNFGLNVASINYRLAPTWRHPAQVEDLRSAVAALREIGASYRIKTAYIGAIGASAGGYIVSAAALSGADDQSSIHAASIWFANSDFVDSTRRSPLEERIVPVTYERALLGSDAGPAEFAAASPNRWDLHAAPPVLLVHGDSDKVVSPTQSALLHESLARHGADSTLIRLAHAGHEDTVFDEQPLLGMVASWMRAHLDDHE